MEIKVSVKWLQKLFNCTQEFIKSTCKGMCCEGGKKILVSVLPEEEHLHSACGVVDGKLKAAEKGKCPYKAESGLCNVHGTPSKPLGCLVSPSTINKKGTLVVRHRYIMMKCYGQGEPAYKTFKSSLVALFGEEETSKIITAIEEGKEEVTAHIDDGLYDKLRYLDGIKVDEKKDDKAPEATADDADNADEVDDTDEAAPEATSAEDVDGTEDDASEASQDSDDGAG